MVCPGTLSLLSAMIIRCNLHPQISHSSENFELKLHKTLPINPSFVLIFIGSVMSCRILSNLTLLVAVVGLTGCDGEKVDLTEYILPTQFNGNVRMVFGNELFLPLPYNDAFQVREYSKNKIEYSKYNVAKDEIVKELLLKNKIVPDGGGIHTYTVGQKEIVDHAVINEKKKDYVYPRFINLDKVYNGNDVGTFDILPSKDSKYETHEIVFKKIKLNEKDCLLIKKTTNLISSPIDDYKYQFDEYAYCKPFGLVAHNLSGGPKKDVVKGAVTKVLDVRRAEEL